MQDRHIVYATIKTAIGHKSYRVSDPLPWGEAQDRWNDLDNERIAANYPDGIAQEGVLVAGTRVEFFSVRAENDPAWGCVPDIKYHVLLPLRGMKQRIKVTPHAVI